MSLPKTLSMSPAAALFCLTAALLAGPTSAQNITSVRVATGLVKPCTLTAPEGDAHRLFVLEQLAGRIRIVKDGVLLSGSFLNLGAKIKSSPQYDQGLLGLAFHPDYATNRHFYVSYTDLGGNSVVERYTAQSGNPDLADPASAQLILGPIVQPQADHNGGCLRFGLDGMLYIALGDGGSTSPTTGLNSQDGSTLLGKMLRLDVSLPAPHIPASNPFVGDPNVLDEIWSFGLRHPWQFSFDRETGDMYIGDVGDNTREEIDIDPAPSAGGLNFGWRCMEGTNCTGLSSCTCNDPNLTLPATDYTHSFGCSVTGGFVYRGCEIPALRGQYVYGDYCTARVWTFTYDRVGGTIGPVIERTAALVPTNGVGTIGSISAFGEDGLGELYICDYSGGEIFKIINLDALVDCNGNQIADSCDIARGGSLDLNGNGVPDECDCPVPVVYCTPKVNSLGCTPTISAVGTPSASATGGFTVRASNVRNQKPGLLLYGSTGRAAAPFQGGTLCINAPVRRAIGANSNGTALPANDCTGLYRLDLNAFSHGLLGGNPGAALLTVGATIETQWWGRDPGFPAPNNVTLSAGLEYQVCP